MTLVNKFCTEGNMTECTHRIAQSFTIDVKGGYGCPSCKMLLVPYRKRLER